ncbi:hypothetical protein [Roseobacter sp.]|uniref:hypothetical protein n=1 Tax=Roseobacter sp. TaxID=1907202 RepID=UPI00385D4458
MQVFETLVDDGRNHSVQNGQAYARVNGAPGLKQEAAGTAIHSTIGEEPDPDWTGAVDQVIVRGNHMTTEAVFFHRETPTVLVTDLVQQIPRGWYRGWRALVARIALMTPPVPSVPRKSRMATTDKMAARKDVRRLLEWPARSLVMAHGDPRQSGGKEALSQAFEWLVR